MRGRRGLCAVSAIGMLLVSLAALLYGDYLDRQRLSQVLDGPYSMTVQVKGNRSDLGELWSAIGGLSGAEGVSVFRKGARAAEDGSAETVLEGVADWDTFPIERLELVEGSLPSSAGDFLATYPTGEAGQTGTMYSFGRRSRMRMRIVGEATPRLAQGIYVVVSNKPFDEDAVLAKLSAIFGESPSDLANVGTREVVVAGSAIPVAAILGVVLALMYLLLVATACASRAKAIGVQKLLGWSHTAILGSICLPSLLAQLAVAALLDVAVFFAAAPVPAEIAAVLLGAQAATALLAQLSALASLAIIRKVPPSGTLKQGRSLRAPLAAAAVLQGAALLCLACLICAFSPTFATVAQRWRDSAAWREEGSSYVVGSLAQTSGFYAYVTAGDTAYIDKFSNLYDMLNDEYGALYTQKREVDGTVFMDVNCNYVSNLGLKDLSGGEISVGEGEARAVVLLPEAMTGERRAAAIEGARSYLESAREAEASLWGDSGSSPDLLVETYEPGVRVFGFDEDSLADGGGMVSDPVFIVFTKANIPRLMRSGLIQTGTDAVVRLPIDAAQAESLESWLGQNGFAEDRVRLVPLSSAYQEELAQASGAAAAMLGMIAALLAVGCVAGALWGSLLALARGKALMVERLLGWGRAARHRRELAFIAAGAAAVACVLLVGRCGPAGLLVGLLSYAAWSATLLIRGGAAEAGNTARLLKEA